MSAPASQAATDAGLADLIATRGEPLLEALDEHLPGSREHAEETGSYAFAAAAELGFGRDRCEAAREAAKLHHAGLVYVPARLLGDPAAACAHDPATVAEGPAAGGSSPSAAERRALAGHHAAGARLARGAGVPERACTWLEAVAERFDGGGPAARAADAIPIEARIIRAACACAAAVATAQAAGEDPGGQREAAIAALRAGAGRELDPRVAEALTGLLSRLAP